jgi:S1-C subfamily serine protease
LPYLAVGGVGGHLPYHRYRAKSFTLGGATMHAPPVTVSDATAGSFASRSVAGNIGLRVISRYDITFDLRGSRVALAPNSIFSAPYVVDRSGLSLDQPTPATFTVLSVVPGSPAAEAGLVTGATIVAVSGASIAGSRLGLDDVQKLTTGTRPYTLTVRTGDSDREATIHPRDILPPPS